MFIANLTSARQVESCGVHNAEFGQSDSKCEMRNILSSFNLGTAKSTLIAQSEGRNPHFSCESDRLKFDINEPKRCPSVIATYSYQ